MPYTHPLSARKGAHMSKIRKEYPNYYLGLDIGTSSIGWAVTDENYNILKFDGKLMWGSRLFEEAQTAQERRLFRTNRRRLQRRRWRLDLLNEIFEKPLNEKDPYFLPVRIKESALQDDERSTKGLKGLFEDSSFADTDYYKKYPTIYHLRKDLMEHDCNDIRLLYLAIHHIIKYRGHFLYDGNFKLDNAYDQVITHLELELAQFFNTVSDNTEVESDDELSSDFSFTETQKQEIHGIITSKDKRSAKKDALTNYFKDQQLFQAHKKTLNELIKLMFDYSIKPEQVFKIEGIKSLQFSSSDYENKYDELQSKLGERIGIIDALKETYDYIILSSILGAGDERISSISDSFVRKYNKSKKDLKDIKTILKIYEPEAYKLLKKDIKCFAKDDLPKLKKGSFESLLHKDIPEAHKALIQNIINDIDSESFLKKPRTSDNSTLPNQMHAHELKAILEKQSKNFPFLDEQDDKGISNKDKILSLCSFKIPYYVGPLNRKSQYSWCIKKEGKEAEKVLPWTFEEVIDLQKSGKAFIDRLINECSYIKGEPVLPKYSLLYQEFSLLNELNKIKVNGRHLSQDLKEQLIEELFKNQKSVSLKAFKDYLNASVYHGEDLEVTGLDSSFNASLSTWVDLLKIINREKLEEHRASLEEAIKFITIYNQEPAVLKEALKKLLDNKLESHEIDKILKLKYTGWGRLSKKLLDDLEFVNQETGELLSVIQALRSSNHNFMELMSYPFTLKEKLNELDKNSDGSIAISYESIIEDLNVSPSLKRSIWQCIKIIEEIKKVTKKAPSKIFVEVARAEDNTKKGKKTDLVLHSWNTFTRSLKQAVI